MKDVEVQVLEKFVYSKDLVEVYPKKPDKDKNYARTEGNIIMKRLILNQRSKNFHLEPICYGFWILQVTSWHVVAALLRKHILKD